MTKWTLAFKHFAELVAIRLLVGMNNNLHVVVSFVHGRSITEWTFLTSRFWVIVVVLENQRAHLLRNNYRMVLNSTYIHYNRIIAICTA